MIIFSLSGKVTGAILIYLFIAEEGYVMFPGHSVSLYVRHLHHRRRVRHFQFIALPIPRTSKLA